MAIPMFRKISTITLLAIAMLFTTIAKAQYNIDFDNSPTPWEELAEVVKLNHVDTRYISVLDYPDSSTLDTINRYLWKELGLKKQVTFTGDITYGDILCMSMAVRYAGDSSINAHYQRCRYSTEINDYWSFWRRISSQIKLQKKSGLDRQHIEPLESVQLEMKIKLSIIACYKNWYKCLEDDTCKLMDWYLYKCQEDLTCIFIKRYFLDIYSRNFYRKEKTDSSILLLEGFEQIEKEIELYNYFVLHKYNTDFTSFGPDSLEIKNNCAKMLWKKEVDENSIAKMRAFAHTFPESDIAKQIQIPTKINKLTALYQNNNALQERHRSLARQCHNMKQRGDTTSEGYKTHMAEMHKIEISYWESITRSYMRGYNPYPADVISFLNKYPAGYYSDTATNLLKKMHFSADSNEGILFFGNISKNFEKEPNKLDSVRVIVIDTIRKDTVLNWLLNRGETKRIKLPVGVYNIVRLFNVLDTNPGPTKQLEYFVAEKDTLINIVRSVQCEITTRVEVSPYSFHKYVFFRYPVRNKEAGENNLYQTYSDAKTDAKVQQVLQDNCSEEYRIFIDKLKALKDNYLQTK